MKYQVKYVGGYNGSKYNGVYTLVGEMLVRGGVSFNLSSKKIKATRVN